MIIIGVIFAKATKMVTTIGISMVFLLILALLLMFITGAAIRATTAGLIPLKAFSTKTLSFIPVKKEAIIKIIKKDGKTDPKVVAKTPKTPLLYILQTQKY